MTHPYYFTVCLAVGVVALAITALFACLARWAWHAGSARKERRMLQRDLLANQMGREAAKFLADTDETGLAW